MRKFLIVFLVAGVSGGIVVGTHLWRARESSTSFEGGVQAADPQDKPSLAPEFPEGIRWVQSEPLTLEKQRGQVVIVHFWTFGCINCIHNYPVYKAWQEKYADKGVTVIGVHTPEFANEKDVDRIKTKARDNGLKFPIAIDNDSKIWKKWDNHYWPSIYLLDKKGRIRFHWDGELHLDTDDGKKFASRIDELLAEKP